MLLYSRIKKKFPILLLKDRVILSLPPIKIRNNDVNNNLDESRTNTRTHYTNYRKFTSRENGTLHTRDDKFPLDSHEWKTSTRFQSRSQAPRVFLGQGLLIGYEEKERERGKIVNHFVYFRQPSYSGRLESGTDPFPLCLYYRRRFTEFHQIFPQLLSSILRVYDFH